MSNAGPDDRPQNAVFGSTEMSRRIYAKDWSKSSFGALNSWSANLVSSVSSCLATPLPTAIWWGQDLTKVYNDAFAKLFNLDGSEALGSPGLTGLPKILDGLQASIKKVFETGIAAEHKPPIAAGGVQNPLLFLSTPIYSSTGQVGGVYTMAVNTNGETSRLQRMTQSEVRLRMVIDSSDLGTWDFSPLSGTLILSDKCRSIYGIPVGLPVDLETFSQYIYPDDKLDVEGEIRKALDPSSGGKYDITHRIVRFSDGVTRWVHSHGKTYFNEHRQAEHFVGTISDVTEEKDREQKRREDQFKMLLTLRASSMGSYEWDIISSKFQYSDRLAEIFGHTETQNLKQKDFSDRIHPDDKVLRLEAHEEAFRSGTLFYEARTVWPDNSIHWVRVSGQTMFDQNGRPARMYGTVIDITESKTVAEALERKVKERTLLLEQKNEELKISEERYVRMTEEVEDYAIILLDKDGTILNWNRGAQKIKGYSESEIIGKNFEIFYLEDDRATNLPFKLIGEAKSAGRAMHEGWRKRKDGSKFWGSIVITALHDERGNVIGFTKVTRDLTERKLAEDMLRQHASELEIKNKQLEQFAYIASHDLQEPLRKIQTFIHVLERRIDNAEAREKYFQKINAAAKRMAELIQSVLNYSRLSQSDDHFTPADLNEILENVKVDYELLISEKSATVTSSPLPTIKGIPLQLSQLFANLMGNALKFSIGKPVISIAAERIDGRKIVPEIPALDSRKDYIKLTFRDNGIGFDQQYAEKIFTIFQRLNRKEDYAGTGIGLALCKKIVDNHHGHIKAEGTLGKGATFTVYLPE